VAEIHEAFAGVTRDGGVSWSESDALDDYKSKRAQRKARESDTDTSWTELINDESWDPDAHTHCWCYLDAIGFRYYLPAGMVRCVRSGHDEGLSFWLAMRYPGDRRVYGETWSLLEERQCRCVARFLRYMARVSQWLEQRDWVEAYESHWKQYD